MWTCAPAPRPEQASRACPRRRSIVATERKSLWGRSRGSQSRVGYVASIAPGARDRQAGARVAGQTRSELAGCSHRFVALCEDVGMPAEDRHDREAARSRIFDAAQTLAAALLACDRTERWEPLRDLILAGLQAGGLRHPDASTAAVSTASSELAAALGAHRHLAEQTGTDAVAPRRHNRVRRPSGRGEVPRAGNPLAAPGYG